MIAAATQQIESSDAHLRTAMHLQICRAELHAYLAGLLYSMGYTNLLERQSVGSEYGFSNVQIENVDASLGKGAVEQSLKAGAVASEHGDRYIANIQLHILDIGV